MHKKSGKDRTCGSGDMLADRQTDTQTDILITILRNRSRERSKKTATHDGEDSFLLFLH